VSRGVCGLVPAVLAACRPVPRKPQAWQVPTTPPPHLHPWHLHPPHTHTHVHCAQAPAAQQHRQGQGVLCGVCGHPVSRLCARDAAGGWVCCAVLCCAVLCCAVLCCAVLCCAVLCCAVLCCAVLCCAVLTAFVRGRCLPQPACTMTLQPPPSTQHMNAYLHTHTHTHTRARHHTREFKCPATAEVGCASSTAATPSCSASRSRAPRTRLAMRAHPRRRVVASPSAALVWVAWPRLAGPGVVSLVGRPMACC
jgi:hypothetical protein